MAKPIVQVDDDGRKYVADIYTYSIPPITSLAPAGISTPIIQIESDNDFVWTKTAVFADIGGAVQTLSSIVVPLVTIAISDSGSGKNLQNRAIPAGIMAGQEGLPFNLSVPRVIGANSTLTFTITNYSNATTYSNLYIALIGYKKYYFNF